MALCVWKETGNQTEKKTCTDRITEDSQITWAMVVQDNW